MTDSNRLRLTGVKQTVFGTTQGTPRMRKMRTTGESLKYAPLNVDSDDIRDDRMSADTIKVGETSDGGINFDFHYPVPDSVLSTGFESAMLSTWMNTPSRDNDGVAEAVISDVAAAGGVVTCTTGDAFVAGQLVLFSGFTNAANNGVFECTTGSATVPAFTGQGLVNEAAPPAAAAMKVVGFIGDVGDIDVGSASLISASLNFTLMGLHVGGWIKVGGTATLNKFGTAANNGWARIISIAANLLGLDNLPSGWGVENGSTKEIKVWFGDYIKNGTTRVGITYERGFMGQSVPTYILQETMTVNVLSMSMQAKQKVTGSFAHMGLAASEGTTSADASPDDEPAIATYAVMAAGANIGRIAENGSSLSSPNWVRGLEFQINNNLRMIDAVDSVASVDIGVGECMVTVNLRTYFGSRALYTKVLAGTPTNVNARLTKNSQAVIFGFPRLTPTEGSPNASAKNSDVELPLALKASKDTLTSSHVMVDRLPYYES